MSDDVALRLGRGGAGNYLTKKDLENSSIQHEDLEAQKPSTCSPPIVGTEFQSQSSSYLRTGRGGFGNFITPSEQLPPSSSDDKSDLQSTRNSFDSTREKVKDKITSDKSMAYRGISGRGGAGNWRQGGEEEERRRVEEEEMRSEVNERVRLDVEKGLKPPPKSYAGR